MKLRLRGNSIRLRLTQKEVNALAQGQDVRETTALAPGHFLEFGIHPSTADRVQISPTPHGFFVIAPQNVLDQWAASDDEGFEASVAVSESDTTHILIQKDFACLKPRGEEDRDTFAHPNAGTQEC